MWEERTSFHYTPGLSKNFPSLTNPQSITTNDHSTPSHHHHYPTSIIKENQPTQSQAHSILNPFITHLTRNLVKPNHHPPNRWQDHQNPAMNQKKQVDQDQNPPTHTHNQPKNQEKKKKPATNRSERDRRLTTPPPPCDSHRHALHPHFRVLPPHPICSWRDSTWLELLWSKLIFLWMIREFMDTRRNEIRKEEY